VACFLPIDLYSARPSGFHSGGLYAVPKLAAARTGLPPKARRLIQREANTGEPLLISLLVLLELEWVLRSRYAFTKPQILTVFSALMQNADLSFEDEPSVELAIYSWNNSLADFADCLIAAHTADLAAEVRRPSIARRSNLPDSSKPERQIEETIRTTYLKVLDGKYLRSQTFDR
jgi:predicted nucleic-acid-binding protein